MKLIPAFVTNSSPVVWLNNFTRKAIANMLATGTVPEHVALIMDGNRRYAKTNGLPTQGGHEAGSATLLEIVDVSLQLGIRHLSIYAFSIENFNRSKEEVDLLFSLLVERLDTFLEHRERVDKAPAVRIRIIGNKSLIPPETLYRLENIEKITQNNTKLVLNVCFAYTSRDEISHSVGVLVDKFVNHETTRVDIDEIAIYNNFYFGPETPPVNLLIRTSGHTRLSDFLMWQVCQDSHIEFLNVYWPSFTSYHFYAILVKYGYFESAQLAVDKLNSYTSSMINYVEDEPRKQTELHRLPPHPPFVSVLGKR